MRLIDADAIPYETHYVPDGETEWEYKEEQCVCKSTIDQMPTIEARPVVRGEWVEYDCFCCNSDGEPVVKTGSIFACSVCGREEQYREPFCHCGADMRGDPNE